MATYRNISEEWGDNVDGLTLPDYIAQSKAFGVDPELITADADGVYYDGKQIAEAESTASAAARAMRAIPSEARSKASRENGKKGGRAAKAPYDPTYHRDGTVTYWSVYRQVWVRSVLVSGEELAAMDERTRARVIRHLGR